MKRRNGRTRPVVSRRRPTSAKIRAIIKRLKRIEKQLISKLGPRARRDFLGRVAFDPPPTDG